MTHDLQRFKPVGDKVYEFDKILDKHRHYEIYKIGLSKPQANLGSKSRKNKTLSPAENRLLQAMFFFYIESASFIEDDPSWNYFLLYETVK
jgi:hypothetical protein